MMGARQAEQKRAVEFGGPLVEGRRIKTIGPRSIYYGKVFEVLNGFLQRIRETRNIVKLDPNAPIKTAKGVISGRGEGGKYIVVLVEGKKLDVAIFSSDKKELFIG